VNPAYQKIIEASERDRRDLFLTTATRVGTTIQNIEKDFWVCWTLDALFHRLKPGGPRLLFKGGTSLSKAYGLISRFSEDIDVTVFREDIGEPASFEELERLSKNKRNRRLEEIKTACQAYINEQLLTELNAFAKETMEAAGQDKAKFVIVADKDDPDKQSLLIHYPSVAEPADYVTPSVKIESGAKSALDPHTEQNIIPYISGDMPPDAGLEIAGVVTITPELTFLDKILILHGLTYYFEAKGALRGNGRMSRHHYDVYQLMGSEIGERACSDNELIDSTIRHASMFFYRNNTGLEQAKRGTFRLRPHSTMMDALARDYDAMATMIFGTVPDLKLVLDRVAFAEEKLNAI
jgi:hypothetical protein